VIDAVDVDEDLALEDEQQLILVGVDVQRRHLALRELVLEP
jgi:hypothetical protein